MNDPSSSAGPYVTSAREAAERVEAELTLDSHVPVQPDQEWANALTHGLAAVTWVVLGVWLVAHASSVSFGLAIACAAYSASVVGTFASSTLSHVFLRQPWLDRFRSWDQAMIYLMIIGTYTPITFRFASSSQRDVLLILMWSLALAGFINKLFLKHRIHSISTVTYLALGWLPAIPLFGRVPMGLFGFMLAGGVIYTLGVWFLVNDHRRRYWHAIWHLFVMVASITHLAGIAWYVLGPSI